jgi:hypothetical protein
LWKRTGVKRRKWLKGKKRLGVWVSGRVGGWVNGSKNCFKGLLIAVQK